MKEHGKENAERQLCRLWIGFSVRGEARFLSHRDMMGLMAYALGRAKIALRFTQGFNPHPKLILPLPRPVGVASEAERLLMEVAEPIVPAEAIRRLARQMPEGIDLTVGELLACGRVPQACLAEYTLAVEPEEAEPLRDRLAELDRLPHWPWNRLAHKAGGQGRQLNLRDLISDVNFDASILTVALTPHDQVWARCEEVLGLLQLDPADSVRLVRTTVGWIMRAQ